MFANYWNLNLEKYRGPWISFLSEDQVGPMTMWFFEFLSDFFDQISHPSKSYKKAKKLHNAWDGVGCHLKFEKKEHVTVRVFFRNLSSANWSTICKTTIVASVWLFKVSPVNSWLGCLVILWYKHVFYWYLIKHEVNVISIYNFNISIGLQI